MGFKNCKGLDEVRSEISECIASGDNCVIAVDFSRSRVQMVIPVRLNRYQECTNEEAIFAELELAGCGKRKFKKQALPRLYDCESILIFSKQVA